MHLAPDPKSASINYMKVHPHVHICMHAAAHYLTVRQTHLAKWLHDQLLYGNHCVVVVLNRGI